MKKLKFKNVIASILVVASTFTLNPIGVKAEWKKDNTGWWFTEGSSWSVGWRLINSKWYFFDQDGYMKTGWLKDNSGKWYYLNSSGDMASNVTVDGYTVGSDGAWIEKSASTNTVSIKANSSSGTEIASTTAVTTNASSSAGSAKSSGSGGGGGSRHSSNTISTDPQYIWINNHRVRIPTQAELSSPANIVSVFYKLDDLSITMIMEGEHTIKAYYGDDLSKKAESETTYGVIIVNSVAYTKYDYLNTANIMCDSSWNQEYKIVNDNGVIKLVSRTIEETEQAEEERRKASANSLSIFYYLKDGKLAGASEGIQQLRFFGDENPESILQTYGMLIVNRSDYGDFRNFVLRDYVVLKENGQLKLVKKENTNNSDDLSNIPIKTTTSSAVTVA